MSGYSFSTTDSALIQAYQMRQNNSMAASLTKQEKGSTAGADFLSYMNKSPTQRMWDSFLKTKGLTEDTYAQLSSSDQEKLAEAFRKEIETKIQKETEEKAQATTTV